MHETHEELQNYRRTVCCFTTQSELLLSQQVKIHITIVDVL